MESGQDLQKGAWSVDEGSGPRLPGPVRLLQNAQLAAVAAFSAALLAPDGWVPATLRDVWLGNLVYVLPALVIFARGWVAPRDRAWAWSLAAAVSCFLAGNLIYLLWTLRQDAPPYPSWADVPYLAVSPFLLLTVLLSVRSRVGRLRWSVLLDGVVATLAALALGGWVAAPTLGTIEGSGLSLVVATAYPVGDVLIIAMAIGVLAARGGRPGPFYRYLLAGLTVFAVADFGYAYRVAYGTYDVGTPLDALWAIGIAIVAHGVWRPAPERAGRPDAATAGLWVVAASGLVAQAVLVAATQREAPPLVIALALATLLACGARTLETFIRARELAVVRRQAATDDLTGIPNRRAFSDAIERAMSRRARGRHLALALIDLDGFKEVNDSLGHHAGDQLLQEVSRRLSAEARNIDPALLLARLGGDEFAVMVPDASGCDEVEAIAERMQAALADPVRVAGINIHVRASIGVALAPEHAQNRSDLLRCADMAMYAAKASGGGVRLFHPAHAAPSIDRLQLIEDLHGAVRAGTLSVHYQPIVDLRGVVRGAEALVRWEHPRRGMLRPDEFPPLAEDHKLMPAITSTVLRTAVGDCSSWRRRHDDALTVSVNISASDLLDPGLPATVSSVLRGHDLPAAALTLEITESQIMTDPDRAGQTVAELRDLGVQLAIDDYGTGHCSLSYLRRLPVQELKIDRSYVSSMAVHDKDAAIVRSTIQLAHALGMRTVAEGVEDGATAALLDRAGCDLAQGWHFAAPMPSPDLSAWLEAAGRSGEGHDSLAATR